MSSDLEEQKKSILPFMQRAQEIQQADPKVAYYCRMYAVDQALKLPHRAKEITGLLAATLNQLERDKMALRLDPEADRIHCLGFALRIFDNADRVDRAGRATERTAVAFYAASVFIEILNQFEGGVDAELSQKQRYCVWRTAEIRKALREGRQPTPPPAVEPPADGGDARSSGGGDAVPADLANLPLASGSSTFAYGGQSQPLPPPPPPAGLGVFGVSGGSYTAGGPPPLPLPLCASLTRPGEREDAGPMAPLPVGASFTPGSPGARLWPGVRVLVPTEEGLPEEDADEGGGERPTRTQVGTVGQLIRRPDGGFSYKVALADRLVELPDEAAVPLLREGEPAMLLLPPPQPGTAAAAGGGGVQPPSAAARVLLINSASWPPTFLVQTTDGKEHTVSAQRLTPPPRDGVTAAAAAPPPPSASASSHQSHLPPPTVSAPPPRPAYGAGTQSPQPPPHAPSPYPSVVHGGGNPSLPPGAPQAYSHSYSGPIPPAGTAQGYGYPTAAPRLPGVPSLPPGYRLPVQVIMDAQKQAKYAVSALSFEDITTAVKHLGEALRLLTEGGQAPQGR